jgi:hypothetical protein
MDRNSTDTKSTGTSCSHENAYIYLKNEYPRSAAKGVKKEPMSIKQPEVAIDSGRGEKLG